MLHITPTIVPDNFVPGDSLLDSFILTYSLSNILEESDNVGSEHLLWYV